MDRNYAVITFVSKYLYFKKAWSNQGRPSLADKIATMFIKTTFKYSKLKELEIMY